MLTLIGGLLSQVLGGVTDHFKHKRELAAAETENRARLLRDEKSNNHEWEMANLRDKDKLLRWISFGMFTWPFVWIGFDPEAARQYFEILAQTMPDWYQEAYLAMTGGIWGISALKNAAPSIVSGIVGAVRKD
jgi:hypothetical protein